MIRTKAALAAAACITGLAAGSIGAAQADTGATGTTGTTGATGVAATVTVNGAGIVNADTSASSAALQADYLAALGAAMTDAHTKAVALATQSGSTLAGVLTITEQTNDGGGLCGVRVFNAASGVANGAPVPTTAPTTSKKKGHHKTKPKATARIADATTSTACTIEADVTVSYAMS